MKRTVIDCVSVRFSNQTAGAEWHISLLQACALCFGLLRLQRRAASLEGKAAEYCTRAGHSIGVGEAQEAGELKQRAGAMFPAFFFRLLRLLRRAFRLHLEISCSPLEPDA